MSIKTLSALMAVLACGATLTVASCDSNGTSPDAAGNGKGLRTLGNPPAAEATCPQAVGSTECALGGATLATADDGAVTVSNLSDDGASGISYAFSSPISVWNADATADFTADDQTLKFEAQDADGNAQAAVELTKNAEGYQALPTFASNPRGGAPLYDVQILDANGAVVGEALSVAGGTPIDIYPNGDPCTIKLKGLTWAVTQANVAAQCIWKLQFVKCCDLKFVLPNGQVYFGTAAKFTEKNQNGIYAYVQTGIITGTGTVSSATLSSATARLVAAQ